jgi:hypothetical protein
MTDTEKKFIAFKELWHESGAWRRHSLEDFIRTTYEIVANNKKQWDKDKSKQ